MHNKNAGPLVKNYEEHQGWESRALNQAWGPPKAARGGAGPDSWVSQHGFLTGLSLCVSRAISEQHDKARGSPHRAL